MAFVFPLSLLVNKIRGREDKKISWSHQLVMVWSGLRGAIAFALAMQNTDTDAGKVCPGRDVVGCFFACLTRWFPRPAPRLC